MSKSGDRHPPRRESERVAALVRAERELTAAAVAAACRHRLDPFDLVEVLADITAELSRESHNCDWAHHPALASAGADTNGEKGGSQ